MDGMLLNSPGGSDGLVDYDKLKTTLRELQNADSKKMSVVMQQLPQSTGDEFLDSKIEALKYLAGPTGAVKSEGDGSMSTVIQEIQTYISDKSSETQKPQNGVAMAENSFNWVRYSQTKNQAKVNPSSKKKKKTKANPFRVLMGMVGKLLDHGVPKPTVVRHVTKNTSFDESTVDRAVDIVREYNRKKQHNENDSEEEIKMQEGETPKKIKSAFNYARFIEAQKAENAGSSRELYNAEPQWEKRSTAELFSRLTWLNSLMGYDAKNPMGDGKKAADKQGANSHIDTITSELKHRGFSQEEIDAQLHIKTVAKG